MSYLQYLTQYGITAIFIFLLYFAVRSGARHHKIAGFILALIFLIAGIIISGTDGTLLILGAAIILILTLIEKGETEEDE